MLVLEYFNNGGGKHRLRNQTENGSNSVKISTQFRQVVTPDLEYGREGTDEPLTVDGGDLQVVEMVRLQVGHHLGVDGVLHGHVRGQLAVAEDENLTEREKRAE